MSIVGLRFWKPSRQSRDGGGISRAHRKFLFAKNATAVANNSICHSDQVRPNYIWTDARRNLLWITAQLSFDETCRRFLSARGGSAFGRVAKNATLHRRRKCPPSLWRMRLWRRNDMLLFLSITPIPLRMRSYLIATHNLFGKPELPPSQGEIKRE